MIILSLSRDRVLDTAITFEHPDEDSLALSAGPEAMAAAAEGLLPDERTQENLDRIIGMGTVTAIRLTVATRAGQVETSIRLTKNEAIRLRYELVAAIKAMNKVADLIDPELRPYREQIRRQSET